MSTQGAVWTNVAPDRNLLIFHNYCQRKPQRDTIKNPQNQMRGCAIKQETFKKEDARQGTLIISAVNSTQPWAILCYDIITEQGNYEAHYMSRKTSHVTTKDHCQEKISYWPHCRLQIYGKS